MGGDLENYLTIQRALLTDHAGSSWVFASSLSKVACVTAKRAWQCEVE